MAKFKHEKQQILEDTQSDVEETERKFNMAIYNKAYAKLKRWCINAYGDFDLVRWMDERGTDEGCFSIVHYYDKCEARIFDTTNREVYNQRREKIKGTR